MNFKKLFAVLAISVCTLNVFAENTASAKIEFESALADPVAVFVYENATENQLVDYIAPLTIGDYTIKAYATIGSKNYGSVKQASLAGLQIYFKANAKEKDYTIKFSGVTGNELKLQKGDDDVNLIPMTQDYNFSCTNTGEEIMFTIVVAPRTYTRNVANGSWGTICYPYEITKVEGANMYEIAGINAAMTQVSADPVSGNLEAGKAYLFNATAASQVFTYEGSNVGEPEDNNGLIGTFTKMYTTEDAWVVKGQQIMPALAGSEVPEYRAYIKLGEITPITSAPARAGRMIFNVASTPTGFEAVEAAGMKEGKMIMNGKFIIVKDGKMFNAQGAAL